MVKSLLPDAYRPLSDELVRYTEAGNVLECMFASHRNKGICVQKLDANTYVDTRTGEIKEFNHNESRADDLNSVRQSLNNLCDYINTNVTNTKDCLWITLTYAENMTDSERLYRDFENLKKRLKYWLKNQGLKELSSKNPKLEKQNSSPFEYIVAMEPQGRGAWHAHLLLIFPEKAPFIPSENLAEIWRNGFVKIKKLDNVDNVGAYLTAYLGDMELKEAVANDVSFDKYQIHEVEIQGEDGKPQKKRIVKGARLPMYPSGFHFYRCSNGIKKPTVEYMTYAEAMEKVGAATPTYERTVELTDPETGFRIVISRQKYNIIRKKEQGVDSDDGRNGLQRVFDNPAAEGEQSKDDRVLPKMLLTTPYVPWIGYWHGTIQEFAPEELFSHPASAEPIKQQHKELYQGHQGFFDLDVPGGIHIGQPCSTVHFTESSAQDNRRFEFRRDCRPL